VLIQKKRREEMRKGHLLITKVLVPPHLKEIISDASARTVISALDNVL
jgi:hypothetical protein